MGVVGTTSLQVLPHYFLSAKQIWVRSEFGADSQVWPVVVGYGNFLGIS